MDKFIKVGAKRLATQSTLAEFMPAASKKTKRDDLLVLKP